MQRESLLRQQERQGRIRAEQALRKLSACSSLQLEQSRTDAASEKGGQKVVGFENGFNSKADSSAENRGAAAVWSMRAIGYVQSVFMQRCGTAMVDSLNPFFFLSAMEWACQSSGISKIHVSAESAACSRRQ
jgi:hypothetical protein